METEFRFIQNNLNSNLHNINYIYYSSPKKRNINNFKTFNDSQGKDISFKMIQKEKRNIKDKNYNITINNLSTKIRLLRTNNKNIENFELKKVCSRNIKNVKALVKENYNSNDYWTRGNSIESMAEKRQNSNSFINYIRTNELRLSIQDNYNQYKNHINNIKKNLFTTHGSKEKRKQIKKNYSMNNNLVIKNKITHTINENKNVNNGKKNQNINTIQNNFSKNPINQKFITNNINAKNIHKINFILTSPLLLIFEI